MLHQERFKAKGKKRIAMDKSLDVYNIGALYFYSIHPSHWNVIRRKLRTAPEYHVGTGYRIKSLPIYVCN